MQSTTTCIIATVFFQDKPWGFASVAAGNFRYENKSFYAYNPFDIKEKDTTATESKNYLERQKQDTYKERNQWEV